jgi:hypothetical protein
VLAVHRVRVRSSARNRPARDVFQQTANCAHIEKKSYHRNGEAKLKHWRGFREGFVLNAAPDMEFALFALAVRLDRLCVAAKTVKAVNICFC